MSCVKIKTELVGGMVIAASAVCDITIDKRKLFLLSAEGLRLHSAENYSLYTDRLDYGVQD